MTHGAKRRSAKRAKAMTDATITPSPEEAAKARKKRYKKTLNLPRTGFPMKANLKQNEPASVKRWARMDLYDAVRRERQSAEPFIFHDGPPYANGNIHVGHLLNRTLKDLVVRTRTMAGADCAFIPGWDCHGLPIEHKVMTDLVESGKIEKIRDLPEATQRMAVRRACHAYAAKFKKVQAGQMERLMTLADYEDPYLTMEPRFEQATLEVFADMVAEGLVYRDLKPVHWSIANATALAEAELEYQDRLDPSIYVWFDALDAAALAGAFGVDATRVQPAGSPAPAFMIWTTTPWTLPANLLIAVHEKSTYVLAELDGRVGVVAKELLEQVTQIKGLDEVPHVLAEVDGAALLGLEYTHPLLKGTASERTGKVVGATYVTLEDGTGLVHTAPGHGADDYQTGLAEGTPIYCPVRGDGTYDDTVPDELRGMSIWDANPRIIEALAASGHLFHAFEFTHSYPHDWRSKTPVVFRATEQWFIAVDRDRKSGGSLRGMALEQTANDIRFIPQWGQKRLRGMLDSRPDWCISRQRSWGLPIPAFRFDHGGEQHMFLTTASVRAVARRVGEKGSDAWFEDEPAELLSGYDPATDADAPEPLRSGAVAVNDLVKCFDIFDVWFESGSSWKSVLEKRQQTFPADLYLEGSDQHRGWFQSSLLCSLAANGSPPFRALLTHGFIVDKDGRKMSKSGGNALDVEELLEDYGADVCRWWVSSLAFENDIKVDRKFFDLASESYRKVRNTLRFLLSNLQDFTWEDAVPTAELASTSIDAWALAQAHELRGRVAAAYEAFDFRRAHLALYDFCNDTLSAIYLDAVKDRLYCDRPESSRRRATQTVCAEIARLLPTLLAPILPHTADEAFAALHDQCGTRPNADGEPSESVHLTTYAELPEVEAHGAWDEVLELRRLTRSALEKAKEQGIENSLDAGARIGGHDDLSPFLPDLADVLGVSRVELGAEGDGVEIEDLRQAPRCERSWKRDATVELRGDGGWLSARDHDAVEAAENAEAAAD